MPRRVHYFVLSLLITTVTVYVASLRVRGALEEHILGDSCSREPFVKAGLHDCHDNIFDVQNTTLGFQEIIAVSLPERTDKRDALTVQAALSDIALSFSDGVDGARVNVKALPHTMDQPTTAIGCWRAHLNLLQDIVARRVSSALVIEDDADWDVSLKSQLVQFARGSRYLLSTSSQPSIGSPYGNDWDLLWLGHCGSNVDPSDPRAFVISHDPTVAPPEKRRGAAHPDMSPWESLPNAQGTTRIVFKAASGVCTAAYAVSLRGAEKMLYHMSMLPFNAPVDWGLGNMCREKWSNFSCIAPYPMLIGVYRPAGNTSKWSNIVYGDESQSGIEERDSSENIVFSTRMNIDNLLAGRNVFESQFPETTGAEMHMEDISRAIGHPEVFANTGLVAG